MHAALLKNLCRSQIFRQYLTKENYRFCMLDQLLNWAVQVFDRSLKIALTPEMQLFMATKF